MAQLAFGVFPNPATNAALIRLDQPLTDPGQLRVWDAVGRLVHTRSVAAGSDIIPVDCAGWPNGLFLLELQSGNARGMLKLVLTK